MLMIANIYGLRSEKLLIDSISELGSEKLGDIIKLTVANISKMRSK